MKKTLRIFSLMLAMLMTLTAFVGVLPAYAEEPDYACKIVSADGTTETYYKYFSPMDAVKIDENTTQSAYEYLKETNDAVTDITTFNPYAAVQNVKAGEKIVFLRDIVLTTLSEIDFGTKNNNGYNTNVNAKGGYIISDGSKAFTIDGNGFSYDSLAGFIASKADITVKNLTINMNGTESVGHARSGHTLTFEGCTITIGGVRAVGTNNAYFEFNSNTGCTLDLSDTTISVAETITPVVPLFMSKTDNNTLKLHNVTATYPLTVIKAVNPGLNITLSGNTSITSAARTVELQNGGTVVMNDNAVLQSSATSGADTTQVIYAKGAGNNFYLEMNDYAQIKTSVTAVGVNDSSPCDSSTIVLNDYSQIDAGRSFRINEAPATLFINDSAKIYHTDEESFDGAKTANPIWVADTNKNCPIYVNADAVISAKSESVRVPFTYDTGVSMSTNNGTVTVKGLRFDSRIQADTAAVEFGTLIAKHETVLGLEDFTHAALLDATDVKYLDVKATAENYYTQKLSAEGNDFIFFAATLTGISESNYNTQYAARAYAKYAKGSTDEDSKSGIWIYSYYNTFDESADNNSSYAYTAYEAVNDTKAEAEEFSDTVDTNGDGFYIYNVAEAGQTAKYSRYTKAQYDKLLEIAESYNPVYVNATNRDTYANTTQANGVNVHEVVIGEAGDGKTETTVVQITDLHFNNENTNKWPLDDVEVTNAQASLAWAKANGQQIVITGDLFNEYSVGNMALVNQYVWNETYKNMTVITLGNHDLINTTDGNPVLSQDWAKIYQSKVLNEKVMIIMLDNASSNDVCTFTDEQYHLLAADLATARAKGYDVLLFYHIPLPTASFADAANQRLDANGDENNTVFNLYEPSHSNYKKWREDYATQNVYKLITDNADIIDAAFCGHKHVNQYSEIQGAGGNVIPQYTLIANAYEIGGSVTKITVYS